MNTVARMKSHDVCRLTGVSYRQFQYWMTIGLFNPTRRASGSGNYVTCDPWHAVTVYAIKYLLPLIPSPELRSVQLEDRIRAEHPLCIVVINTTVHFCQAAQEAVQYAMNDISQRKGETVHIITLRPIYELLIQHGWHDCPVEF